MNVFPETVSPDNVVAYDDKEGRMKIRESIDALESAMQEVLGSESGEMDEINDNGLTEYLIGGAYTRVLKIPEGITIVSKLWKKPRLWIIISGTVRVTTELGNQIIEAPYIGEAPFGSKVALHAETEVLWAAITGLAGDVSLDEVEQHVVANDYSELSYPWSSLEVTQ